MSESLAERQAAILRAVVREYIRTGEPVGSKWLATRSRMNVSPATIRNEMARLEELGYLAHPHTSAGRIPTDAGYRFVVDEIRNPRELGEGQRRVLEEEMTDSDPASVDDLLHRASDVVARFTHHAAAVLTRRARSTRLRRLELFPMGARLASLVLIAENGRVEQRMLTIEEQTEHDIETLGSRLGSALAGETLDDALATLEGESTMSRPGERPIIDGVAAAVRSLRDTDDRIVVGGVANLAGESDFERETLHRMYEALEQQTAVLELLASALDAPVSVRIGSELSAAEFQSCSIVVANFGTGDAQSSVGIIGPTRMDYERMIATANTVARMLGTTLGAAGE